MTHPCTHPPTLLSTRPPSDLPAHPHNHLPTFLSTGPPMYPLTHPLTHPFTKPSTQQPTHSPSLLTTHPLYYQTTHSSTLLPSHLLLCVLCINYVAYTYQPSITPLSSRALVEPFEVNLTKYSHCSDPNLFHYHYRHDCHGCQQRRSRLQGDWVTGRVSGRPNGTDPVAICSWLLSL